MERALRLVTLAWSWLWLAVMTVGLSADSSEPRAVAVVGVIALGGYCLLITLHRVPLDWRFPTGMVIVALALAFTTSAEALWGTEVTVLVPLSILAATTTGLVVTGRSFPWLVALAGAGPASVFLADSLVTGPWPGPWRNVLAMAALALAIGMSARVGATALRNRARLADRAADALAEVRERDAMRAAQRAEARRVERVLHDTVINTLGAIRRGVGDSDTAMVRARCASDLETVRQLGHLDLEEAMRLDSLVDGLVARGKTLGIHVHPDLAAPGDLELPTPVAEALRGACVEALLNVSKHAGVCEADLVVHRVGPGIALAVSDRGTGWDSEPGDGTGISSSIIERAREAGVEAVVSSSPGSGARVELTWPNASQPEASALGPDTTRDQSLRDVHRALAEVVLKAGAWQLGLLLVFSALFWPIAPQVGLATVVAVSALLLAHTAWAGLRRDRIPHPPVTAALVVASAGFLASMPGSVAADCAEWQWGWWGADGAVVALLSLALLTRGKGALFAGAVACAIGSYAYDHPGGEACGSTAPQSTIQCLVVLIALYSLRASVLRLWRSADQARAAIDQLSADQAARAATDQALHSRMARLFSTTAPLLADVASGRLDPRTPEVRRRCADEERALRSLLQLGEEHGWLGQVIAEAVLYASASGRAIEVMPAPRAPIPVPDAQEPLRAFLITAIDRLPRDATATAALLGGPTSARLTLVVSGSHDLVHPPAAEDLAACGLAVQQTVLDDQTLVEVEWTSEPAPSP